MTRVAWLIVICVVLVAAVLLRLLVGETWGWPGAFILELRSLRVVVAVIVGASLAGSGVALQSLLRNPLAEPFILGLSTGAALGLMIQQLAEFEFGLGLSNGAVGALIGAAATMGVVFMAARTRGFIDPLGLLLVGVVISTVNGALIMLVNYWVGPGGLRDNLALWMMGFINEGVSTATLWLAGLVAVACLALLWYLGRAMDAASFSDSEAQSLGVNIKRLREMLFLTASVLAAVAVVLAGPIAFVGIIAPHIARLIVGPSHRTLLVASVLIGAGLIVAADTASVGLDSWRDMGRVPIGVFTALIGGPAFIVMLKPSLGRMQG